MSVSAPSVACFVSGVHNVGHAVGAEEERPLPAVRALHLSREICRSARQPNQVTAAEVVECSRFEAGLRISGAAIALFDSRRVQREQLIGLRRRPVHPGRLTFRFSGRLRSRAEDHGGGRNPADPANSALMIPSKSSRGFDESAM
jgi:hypothetical protein